MKIYMSAFIAAIIVGAAIIASSVIVVLNLPRYQYIAISEKNPPYGSVEQLVFDRVTGRMYSKIRYYSTNPGSVGSSTVNISKKSLIDIWTKQDEVFGGKPFTSDDWKRWKECNRDW